MTARAEVVAAQVAEKAKIDRLSLIPLIGLFVEGAMLDMQVGPREFRSVPVTMIARPFS